MLKLGRNMSFKNNCHCQCGKAAFSVSGKPIARLFCHCTICQNFNAATYADVTLFHAKDVSLPSDGQIEYKQYRLPPAVHRGKCKHCQQPAIELFTIPLLAKLVIIPTANIHIEAFVIPPEMHIFYEHCVDHVDDMLPKYKGYWKSQFALLRTLV